MPPTTLLNGRFTVEVLLGKGGFGEVYSGRDTNTKDPIAVKLERAMSRSWLYHEAKVMQEVGNQPGIIGVPQLRYFGQQGDYRVLVMTMHGKSLEDLHEELGRFSLKTTLMLLDQMIQRIASFHAAGFVHRDLKPDNFLMGLNNNAHMVYIIDFGLSQRYLVNGQHRDMTTGRSFVGTTRYASLRTHQGCSQSRRDDLEQLAYIAVYLHRGRLPWSGLQIHDRDEKERVIGEMKEKLTTAQICSRCPRQFEDLLLYARKMSFDEHPQYDMCRMLVASVMEEMSFTNDYVYDWIQPDDAVRSPMSESLMAALSSANAHGVLSGVLSDAAVQRENDDASPQ